MLSICKYTVFTSKLQYIPTQVPCFFLLYVHYEKEAKLTTIQGWSDKSKSR